MKCEVHPVILQIMKRLAKELDSEVEWVGLSGTYAATLVDPDLLLDPNDIDIFVSKHCGIDILHKNAREMMKILASYGTPKQNGNDYYPGGLSSYTIDGLKIHDKPVQINFVSHNDGSQWDTPLEFIELFSLNMTQVAIDQNENVILSDAFKAFQHTRHIKVITNSKRVPHTELTEARMNKYISKAKKAGYPITFITSKEYCK